ncbi:flagellar biosynthetic protein FliO [Granulosicoccus sp.]|nr:flagellar biosynthetic protein FliO [Granulosicoccus sp.]MDB4224382.1 flagellar biosynthetic protein FliO [Granulosicoccus sp.]
MTRVLAACGVLLCAFWPWACAHAQQSTTSVISPVATLGKLAIALFFVLVVFWVFAKIMKKMQVGQGGAQNGLKVVGALSLGQRERVVVVQVGAEQILLGVTSNQINTLHILDKPLSSSETTDVSEFKQKLSAALQRQVKT